MPVTTRSLSEFTFVEALFAIIIAWTLVSLWVRFIDNLSYRSLHLNPTSTFHALIVALTVTAIFVVFTYSAESSVSNIIIGTTETTSADAETSNGGPSTPSTSSNLISRNIANRLTMGSMVDTGNGRVIMPGSPIDLKGRTIHGETQPKKDDSEIINSILNSRVREEDYGTRSHRDTYYRGVYSTDLLNRDSGGGINIGGNQGDEYVCGSDSTMYRHVEHGRTPPIPYGISLKYDRPSIQRSFPEIFS